MFELKRASYKKIQFFMRVASTRGGRKDVLHEYPGSDRQSVEDLGLKPRSYNITIIINDRDYEQRRDILLAVLSEGENGVLEHPTFGILENIVVRKWKLRETLDDVSRAEIDVEFAINDAPAIPFQQGTSPNELQSLNRQLIDSSSANIEDFYTGNSTLPGVYESAVESIEKVSDAFSDVRTFGANITAQVNIYNAGIVNFTNQINSLVTQPALLANAIATLFANLNELFIAPADTYGAFVALFGFASGSIPSTANTLGRIQRVSNQNIIDKTMNIGALGYAYVASSQLEFQTNIDIEDVEAQLETQYASAINPNLSSEETDNGVNSGISDDMLEDLNDLRVSSLELLDDEILNTKKIISMTVPKLPISVIAYRLYGSTDLADSLVSLNGINQSTFVAGDILVLSA